MCVWKHRKNLKQKQKSVVKFSTYVLYLYLHCIHWIYFFTIFPAVKTFSRVHVMTSTFSAELAARLPVITGLSIDSEVPTLTNNASVHHPRHVARPTDNTDSWIRCYWTIASKCGPSAAIIRSGMFLLLVIQFISGLHCLCFRVCWDGEEQLEVHLHTYQRHWPPIWSTSPSPGGWASWDCRSTVWCWSRNMTESR